MKKEFPIGPAVFAAALLLVGGYFVVGGESISSSPPAQTRAAPNKVVADWKIYDRDRVAFSLPAEWKLASDGKDIGGKIGWLGYWQDKDGYSHEMSVALVEYMENKESRPLKELYATSDWGDGRKHAARNLLVDGGECLDYRIDYKYHDTQMHPDRAATVKHVCVRKKAHTDCYADDRYFSISTVIGHTCDSSQPSAEVQAKEKIYTRFLRSLKFKPVS